MNVVYQNGWKMIDILIHAENIKYFTNASQKSQKFIYYLPNFLGTTIINS
jgi:hypothetical protein